MGKAEKTPVLSFNVIHLFRTVQEIIPIKLNFYTLYELKIKIIQIMKKSCESNAVERVISPYTIKRRPPIYFTRGNIVYGRSVELCNLS